MTLAVIGCGGIGSFFAMHLQRAIQNSQLTGISTDDVTLFDFDLVEPGNLMHQNFCSDEITVHKAIALTFRYGFQSVLARFEKPHLNSYDQYVICADNKAVRHIVYSHCIEYDKKFIDLRSEGRNILIFTDKEDPNTLLGSLGEDKDDMEGHSCRTPQDRAAGQVQMGNAVVAPIGLQVLLQQARGDDYPACIQEDIIGTRNVF